MNAKNLLATSLLAFLAAACGGSDKPAAPTTKAFSCYFTAAGVCTGFTGLPAATDMTSVSTACTANGGTVGTACPTASRVGTCTQPGGPPTETFSYYSPTYTAAAGQTDCASGVPGTWTPG